MDKKQEQKSEFPRLTAQGNKTTFGYTVEARYKGGDPIFLNENHILDKQWRRISFKEGARGVPKVTKYDKDLLPHDLLSLPSAQAVRWWFITDLHTVMPKGFMGFDLETRLVMHEVKLTHDINAISTISLISGDVDLTK